MENLIAEKEYVTCLRNSLCFKLRYLVSCVGVQQKELAAELDIDEGNLSRILNSKSNFGVDTLLRIVDRLGFELSLTVNPPVEIDWSVLEDKKLANDCVNPLISYQWSIQKIISV